MEQSLKRHISNQAALLQIGIEQIAAVARSLVTAIDNDREQDAERLGNVIEQQCDRLIKLAENIEIESRSVPEAVGRM